MNINLGKSIVFEKKIVEVKIMIMTQTLLICTGNEHHYELKKMSLQ